MRSNSTVFPIALILVGAYFLLQKQRLLPDLQPLVHDWWPALLILAGVILLVRRSRRSG